MQIIATIILAIIFVADLVGGKEAVIKTAKYLAIIAAVLFVLCLLPKIFP